MAQRTATSHLIPGTASASPTALPCRPIPGTASASPTVLPCRPIPGTPSASPRVPPSRARHANRDRVTMRRATAHCPRLAEEALPQRPPAARNHGRLDARSAWRRLARRLGAQARGEFGIAGRRQLYARFVNCASRNMSGCWTKELLPPGIVPSASAFATVNFRIARNTITARALHEAPSASSANWTRPRLATFCPYRA